MRRQASVLIEVLTAALVFLVSTHASAATPSPEHARYVPIVQREGDVIRQPTWGVELTIPKFTLWKENPMQGRPNYVLAAQSQRTCALNLSMFVENDKDGVTPEECRRGYAGNPEKLRARKDVTLIDAPSGPLTYSRFDQQVAPGESRLTMNQLYGYWTRDNLCFEVHISSLGCDSGTFTAEALPIVASVKIGPDTGATLETVALALGGGPDPVGWKSHELLGGIRLHGAKPSRPGDARRFYEAALRLGSASIPPLELYDIEAGIAITWLEEHKGIEAIPHLERAISAIRSDSGTDGDSDATPRQNLLDEALYNLVCAHSLAGNPEAACSSARELLSPMDQEHRRAKLKQLRKDDDTTTLLKSDCYDHLLTDLGLD